MMMSDNKKKAATLILKKMSSGAEEAVEAPMQDGAELDQSAGYDAAAEEVMAAVDSKDPQALKAALKSFVDMCMAEAPESEE